MPATKTATPKRPTTSKKSSAAKEQLPASIAAVPSDHEWTASTRIATEPESQLVPLARVFPSKTNPRKTFDPAKLTQLAESLRTHGMLQPILVRPVGNRFEVVAGERRYRAAAIAKLDNLPVNVRELTDLQVLELQVIENNQREDLDPLEEAEGFKALLACANRSSRSAIDGNGQRPAPHAGITVDHLAARIKRDRSYVYKRLKLADLPEVGKKALRDGVIVLRTAELIARIPNVRVQQDAVKGLLDEFPRYGSNHGQGISHYEAESFIKDEFFLILKNAPFDCACAKLCPDAGACTVCPKRTKNDPDLFGDVTKDDLCTDSACFARKRDLAAEKKLAAAKAANQKVLSKKEAEQVWPRTYNSDPVGYVRLDDHVEKYDRSSPTLKSLLKKLPDDKRPKPTVAVNPHTNQVEELISRSDAMKALKKAGLVKAEPKPKSQSTTAAQLASAEEEGQFQELFVGVAVERITAAAEQITPPVNPLEFWRLIASGVANIFEGAVMGTLQRRGLDGEYRAGGYPEMDELLARSTTAELVGLTVELLIHESMDLDGIDSPIFAQAAKLYNIDIDHLKKELAGGPITPPAKIPNRQSDQEREEPEEQVAASPRSSAPPRHAVEVPDPDPDPDTDEPAEEAATEPNDFPFICSACGDTYATLADAEKCCNKQQATPPPDAPANEPRVIPVTTPDEDPDDNVDAYIAEAAAASDPSPPGACRLCGCTEENCTSCVEKTGAPCTWIEPSLCSACTVLEFGHDEEAPPVYITLQAHRSRIDENLWYVQGEVEVDNRRVLQLLPASDPASEYPSHALKRALMRAAGILQPYGRGNTSTLEIKKGANTAATWCWQQINKLANATGTPARQQELAHA